MDDISRQSQAAYILIFYDKTSLIKTELNLITENKVLLSENKVLEEKVSKAEDCSKQRINLISNIGDDIRSPLLTLSDFIDLANGAENLDEAKAYLGYLKSNFDSIKNTLDMILEYSKINNNDITLRNDTINIDKLCREILELSKRKLNKIHHKYIESNLCKTKYIDNEKFINQPIIISDKAKLSYILNKIINSVVELKSISAIEIYYNLAEIDDDNNITRYIDQNIEIKDIFESLYDEITWSKSNIVVEFVLKFYYKINRLAINESFIESDVLIDKISSTINPLIDLLNAKLSYNEKENNYIKLRVVIPYIKPEYLDSPWLKTKN